jgi:hypothetical protein
MKPSLTVLVAALLGGVLAAAFAATGKTFRREMDCHA